MMSGWEKAKIEYRGQKRRRVPGANVLGGRYVWSAQDIEGRLLRAVAFGRRVFVVLVCLGFTILLSILVRAIPPAELALRRLPFLIRRLEEGFLSGGVSKKECKRDGACLTSVEGKQEGCVSGECVSEREARGTLCVRRVCEKIGPLQGVRRALAHFNSERQNEVARTLRGNELDGHTQCPEDVERVAFDLPRIIVRDFE